MFANDHPGIDFRARFDKYDAAIFYLHDAIGGHLPVFLTDQNPFTSTTNVSINHWFIRFKLMIDNPVNRCLCHIFCCIAYQFPRWDFKLYMNLTVSMINHIEHFTFTLAE